MKRFIKFVLNFPAKQNKFQTVYSGSPGALGSVMISKLD